MFRVDLTACCPSKTPDNINGRATLLHVVTLSFPTTVASFNSIGVVVAHYIGGSLAMMLLSRLITAAIWNAPYRWFSPRGDGDDADLVAASNREDDASGLFSDDEGPAASQGATKAKSTKKTKRARKQSAEEQEADEASLPSACFESFPAHPYAARRVP